MTNAVRAPRPYLALTATTIGLIVFLGAVGTMSYLLGFTGYLPLAAAFIPLAIGLIIVQGLRRSWRANGFRWVDTGSRRAIVATLLVALLPISVVSGSSGFAVSGLALLAFAAMAVLVGFVEETIFRGILLRAFDSQSPVAGVVATSIGFAIAHSAAALSPDQSLGASLSTVVFALLFGVIASLLVHLTHSIWPAIALHACFDFLGFVLTPRSATVTDSVSIAVAAILAVFLVVLSRRPRPMP